MTVGVDSPPTRQGRQGPTTGLQNDSPRRRRGRQRRVQGTTTARRIMDDLLGHLREHAAGRDNAVPLADLAAWYGVDWRTVAKAIELLRERGYAVGTARSKPHGAFWPVTDEDYEAALRPFFAAAARMMQTYWRLVKRVPGRLRVRLMEQQQLFSSTAEAQRTEEQR